MFVIKIKVLLITLLVSVGTLGAAGARAANGTDEERLQALIGAAPYRIADASDLTDDSRRVVALVTAPECTRFGSPGYSCIVVASLGATGDHVIASGGPTPASLADDYVNVCATNSLVILEYQLGNRIVPRRSTYGYVPGHLFLQNEETIGPHGSAPVQRTCDEVVSEHAQVIADQLRVLVGQGGFSGPVLAAPTDLAPFSSMQLATTDSSSSSYHLDYRGFGDALISGTVGRDMFRKALEDVAPSCAANASYCGPAQLQASQPFTGEWFRGLAVGSSPALVHRMGCCAGGGWELTWYDAAADVSYQLAFYDASAAPASMQTDEIGPSNIAKAQVMAFIAEQLVSVSGDAAPGQAP